MDLSVWASLCNCLWGTPSLPSDLGTHGVMDPESTGKEIETWLRGYWEFMLGSEIPS